MAELVRVPLGASVKEYTEAINDNFTELENRKADKATNGYATLDADGKVNQTAKTADTAKDYDATSGTIKTALDNIGTNITNITNGTTTVGKAKALNPDSSPGNLKYYGTNASGQIGWHDYTAGSEDPTGMSTVTFDGEGDWTEVSSYYVCTVDHNNKYPGDVYKEESGEYVKVVVGIVRTSTQVRIYSDAPFAGYILLG